MVIDTHAHLNLDPLLSSWEEVVDRAVEAGVGAIVVPGTNEKTSLKAIELAKLSKVVRTAVGLHPSEISDRYVGGLADFVEEYASTHSVVAIGEIGLDYLRLPKQNQEQGKKAQQGLLMHQLEIAKEMSLPAILHSRDNETLHDIVASIETVYPAGKFKGVFHCFSHAVDDFKRLHQLGEAYVGVGGLMCRPDQEELQTTIAQIPLDRIVLETDSPWLVPYPAKAKTNEPANVTIVALKLAALHRVSLDQVLHTTTDNAVRLFQLY